MDLIFNDFSLYGQFSSIDDFCASLQKKIIPCLDLAYRKRVPFLKSYNSYSCLVLKDGTNLHSLLSQVGNSRLAAFRNYLLKIIHNPYWDDDQQTSQNDCINMSPIPNCVTEAFYRRGALLSFEGNLITLSVNGIESTIPNADCKKKLLEIFDEKGVLSLQNSFSVPGYNQYVFEIRSNEPPNHVPHFHVCVDNKYNASVDLNNFKILATNESDTQRIFGKAIALIKSQKEDYLEVWYYYHPVENMS